MCCPTTEAALVALKQGTRHMIALVAVDFDPFVNGHIASHARPGGRITGMTHLQSELPTKRVELLKELLPSARRIAVLADRTTTDQLAAAQAGAKRMGVELHVLEFKTAPYDYESAFADATRAKAEALLALGTANFVPARRRITELGAQASSAFDVPPFLDGRSSEGCCRMERASRTPSAAWQNKWA